MEGVLPYIADILAIISSNINYYEEIKQFIGLYTDENIIEHYKILSMEDSKITTYEDDILLEEPLDKEIIEVLDGFFDFF